MENLIHFPSKEPKKVASQLSPAFFRALNKFKEAKNPDIVALVNGANLLMDVTDTVDAMAELFLLEARLNGADFGPFQQIIDELKVTG